MKLGAIPSKPDRRDLLFSTYLLARPTAPPLHRNWTRAPSGASIKFSLFANDRYGCCTCAALGHVEQAAAVWRGRAATVTEAIVLEGYDSISEWSRTKPLANDNGASCRDALKWFAAKKIIESYIRIDKTDARTIETACNLGGAVYVGANLPSSAQRQSRWDVPANGNLVDDYEPRSWGGHAMAVLGYNAEGVWFVSWGKPQFATWAWVEAYVDERWLAIADEWTEAGAFTPSGFDLERLNADVAKVAS